MGSPIVTVHVWGISARRIPRAFANMARGNASTSRRPGVMFSKQLGTGGDAFNVHDPDPKHWVLLTVWEDAERAAKADSLPAVLRWDRIAEEQWRIDLQPLSSHGLWSKREPFGSPAPTTRYEGPVAAITRARLVPKRAITFWRAVPPVAQSLRSSPGLITAFGIGEAPIGLQGTFSVWDSADSLKTYAYDGQPHGEAIRRTGEVGWYGEELFSRHAVIRASGTLHGRQLKL